MQLRILVVVASIVHHHLSAQSNNIPCGPAFAEVTLTTRNGVKVVIAVVATCFSATARSVHQRWIQKGRPGGRRGHVELLKIICISDCFHIVVAVVVDADWVLMAATDCTHRPLPPPSRHSLLLFVL